NLSGRVFAKPIVLIPSKILYGYAERRRRSLHYLCYFERIVPMAIDEHPVLLNLKQMFIFGDELLNSLYEVLVKSGVYRNVYYRKVRETDCDKENYQRHRSHELRFEALLSFCCLLL